MTRLMMLDVESVGLHGEGFAWGVVVGECLPDGTFEEMAARWESCPVDSAYGDRDGLAWCRTNVPPSVLCGTGYANPLALRHAFWLYYQAWTERYPDMWLAADCAWPVETMFLSTCVSDNPAERCWQGPYPLLDLSPLLAAAGENPTATHDRQEDERPAHHPLMDARQSARQYARVLAKLRPAPGGDQPGGDVTYPPATE